MLTVLLAFFSGVLTVLSPCVLPVLPFLLSGTIGGRLRPYGIMVGFVASFTLVTLFLNRAVSLLGIAPDTVRVFSIGLLLCFGLLLCVPQLHQAYERFSSKSLSGLGNLQHHTRPGFWGGLPVGATLGLLWSPCVGPIMASVMTLAQNNQVNGLAVTTTAAFALGTTLPMTGVMLGGRRLLGSMPALMNNLGNLQRGFGVVLVLVACSMFFNLDRQLQSWVLDTFPNYSDFLTSLERVPGP